VVDVVEGYNNFPRDGFEKHIEIFYPLAVDLLSRDLRIEERIALQVLLRRVGEVKLGVSSTIPITPKSSKSRGSFSSRKGSFRA
jgi:brefeldin A-inhibited guanine nucleotide-exchange protein